MEALPVRVKKTNDEEIEEELGRLKPLAGGSRGSGGSLGGGTGFWKHVCRICLKNPVPFKWAYCRECALNVPEKEREDWWRDQGGEG